MKILLVDDEPQILRALRINLRARGDDVVEAATGAMALTLAAHHRPDAAIIDLGLPDMDGLEVIAGIRGWSTMPILVLSGRGDTAVKVAALDAGADDYLDKPFAIEELFARMRAVVRRNQVAVDSLPQLTIGRWRIDFTARTVTSLPSHPDDTAPDARQVLPEQRLTPTEWLIIDALARHPHRLVTQVELLESIWGKQFRDESGYLRFHVRQLRRKLEPDPARPRYLITEPGVGYRLHPASGD